MRCASATALAVLALAGCGDGSSPVRDDLMAGIERARSTHDDHRLRTELSATLRRLAADDAQTARDGRARRLALRGFALLRAAATSRIAFVENDSGSLFAAKRDARRAYHASLRGGELVREAARLYGRTVALPGPSR